MNGDQPPPILPIGPQIPLLYVKAQRAGGDKHCKLSACGGEKLAVIDPGQIVINRY